MLADELAPVSAEAFAQGGVARQEEHPLAQAGAVAWRNEEAGLVFETDLGGAVPSVGDNRPAGGEGLGEGAREAFAGGEVDDEVHDADEAGDHRRGNEAGEDEVFLEAETADAGLETFAPGAVANEQELEGVALAHEVGRDGEKVLVAFEFEEASDFPDDDISHLEPELGSELRVISGREERFECKAAQDTGELIGAADARGKVLDLHGLSDNDEVVGDVCRTAFSAPEEGVGEGALEGAEGRAVNGMNDERDAGARGGEAAEDAGFAAVSVNDVRAAAGENLAEAPAGEEVLPGMDWPDEFREDLEDAGVVVEDRLEGALGPAGGSGDEVDFEPGLLAEAEDRGDGVFLGPADD